MEFLSFSNNWCKNSWSGKVITETFYYFLNKIYFSLFIFEVDFVIKIEYD